MTEADRMRDALDHIKRMAGSASTMTKRLTRIYHRADDALNGRVIDPNNWEEPPTRLARWVPTEFRPERKGWYMVNMPATGEMHQRFVPLCWTGDVWERNGLPCSLEPDTTYLSARLPNTGLPPLCNKTDATIE